MAEYVVYVVHMYVSCIMDFVVVVVVFFVKGKKRRMKNYKKN